MLTKLNSTDKKILSRLQEDIPFVKRPFAVLARELKIEEGALIKRIAFLKKEGIIRRISAGFVPSRVNFASTLVGAIVSADKVDQVAKRVNLYPEVTHNYLRNAEYNLWFALVAKNRLRIKQIISRLKKDKDIQVLSEFPAVKVFKINVKFKL